MHPPIFNADVRDQERGAYSCDNEHRNRDEECIEYRSIEHVREIETHVANASSSRAAPGKPNSERSPHKAELAVNITKATIAVLIESSANGLDVELTCSACMTDAHSKTESCVSCDRKPGGRPSFSAGTHIAKRKKAAQKGNWHGASCCRRDSVNGAHVARSSLKIVVSTPTFQRLYPAAAALAKQSAVAPPTVTPMIPQAVLNSTASTTPSVPVSSRIAANGRSCPVI